MEKGEARVGDDDDIFRYPTTCRKSMVINLNPNVRQSSPKSRQDLALHFEQPCCLVGFQTIMIKFLDVSHDGRVRMNWRNFHRNDRRHAGPDTRAGSLLP